jgi:hypothetical protein
MKTTNNCYKSNYIISDIINEYFKEKNYKNDSLMMINYNFIEDYSDCREDIKKCMWKIINQFEFYANTFYLALYIMDYIYVNNYEKIKLTELDIICLSCIVLSSILD